MIAAIIAFWLGPPWPYPSGSPFASPATTRLFVSPTFARIFVSPALV